MNKYYYNNLMQGDVLAVSLVVVVTRLDFGLKRQVTGLIEFGALHYICSPTVSIKKYFFR